MGVEQTTLPSHVQNLVKIGNELWTISAQQLKLIAESVPLYNLISISGFIDHQVQSTKSVLVNFHSMHNLLTNVVTRA